MNFNVYRCSEVGSACCYYVSPGDFCSVDFAAWGLEMTPPDSSGGAELRPTLTVKVSTLVASAGLEKGDDDADKMARSSWVASDGSKPGTNGPHDVLLSSVKLRRELTGEASDKAGWAEIDLEGGSALPRVVSSTFGGSGSGENDKADSEARGWLNSFNSHCPEHNPSSPVQ
jgi:hypothetical protein